MAGARKLQADIDRTLKKINEGIVEFDGIYENIQSTEGQVGKMKLEEDLKKEIKKLQRYRDQLKSWITSPDIKNKQPLTDCRSLIERRMEIFKIVERETKTKAYSKEGLMRDQTVSAEERKRLKVRDWVQDLVSKMYDEIDTYDTELETLQENSGSKLSKKDKETITTIENVVKNHKQHIDNLEIITRLLDDNKVDPDEVDGIKEDLDYYMEQAKEVDYEPDFGIYDAFDLSGAAMDNEEEDDDDQDTGTGADDDNNTKPTGSSSIASSSSIPVANVTTTSGSKTPVASSTSTVSSASITKSSSASSSTGPSTASSSTNKPNTSTVPSKTGATAPPPGLTSTSSRSNESSSSTSPIASITATANVTTTGGSFSSKVTANTSTKVTTPVPNVPTPVTPAPITNKSGESMANILRNKTAASTTNPTASTVSTPVVSAPSTPASTVTANNVQYVATVNAGTATLAPSVASIIARAQQQQQQQQQQATTVSTTSTVSSSTASSGISSSSLTLTGTPNVSFSAVGPPKGDGITNPLFASSTAAASVIIPEPILQNPWVPLSLQQLRYNANVLSASISHLPEAIDTERPKPYIPKQPYPSHAAFPQQPTLSLDIPSTFEHFNIDTLFFIFYYNQNSYHQYLAARELRKHAWRFHKKYTTWFLRGENENRIQTETSETGTYLYFDYESGWCQRLKKGFTFEYSNLEDELV